MAVTVTDLQRSTTWYTTLFGAEPVLDEDETTGGFHHTVYLIGGGQLLGLHTHPQGTTETFDAYRPGLDHASFACRDRDQLITWSVHLDQLGIAHGEVVDGHDGSGVWFRDPDGIPLEFFAPPVLRPARLDRDQSPGVGLFQVAVAAPAASGIRKACWAAAAGGRHLNVSCWGTPTTTSS